MSRRFSYLAILVVAVTTAARDDTAPVALLPNEVMQAFTGAFDGIEQGLISGDAESVVDHATRLLSTCGQSASLAPQRNDKLRARFDSHLVAVADLSTEVAQLAGLGDLAQARRATEDLRAQCVACHARFRSEEIPLDGRPSKGVTIMGQVELLDIDGKPRSDRSDVVIFVQTEQALGPFAPPRRNPVISQAGRQFTPRVLPVVRGTTVDFPNDDITFHNVFSLSQTQPFDLGIYAIGETRSVSLNKAGLVRVYCNIHPDMLSSVLVLPNPYFALTDEDGFFVITSVPSGDYTLSVWNEMGGEWETALTVSDPVVTVEGVMVREDTFVIEHKDKFGRPYREKY